MCKEAKQDKILEKNLDIPSIYALNEGKYFAAF